MRTHVARNFPSKDAGSSALARHEDTSRAWRDLTKLAHTLQESAPDAPNLRMALGILARLLKSPAIAITLPDASHVLAKWGRTPKTTFGENSKHDAWTRRPLIVGNVEYGILWIRHTLQRYNSAHRELLDAAVQLLATAVHAQAILQQEREKRALAETLQHVSEALTSTLDLDQVLARILDELARLVPYDSALVMLLENGKMHLHAQRGYKRLSRQGTLEQVTFVPETTAKVMDVLNSTVPVIVPDIREVPDWVWVPFSTHIRSWMGVPLRVHEQATGLFSIDKAEPNFFTARHAAAAAAVAPHAAIAIENARLFQELSAAESQLRQLSAHVIQVQEAERQRIGRELHDHAGQAILAMRAELQILARQMPPSAAQAQTQLAKVDSILRTTARDLRLLSHELRSHLLDELGLKSALQQQIQDLKERFGIHAELIATGSGKRYPRAIELAAFRIAQEALTNVARHAQAKYVRVELVEAAEYVRLTIQDDGVGFAIERTRNDGTLGLIGMRERAVVANGIFEITSHPGTGTRIVVEFPIATGTEV